MGRHLSAGAVRIVVGPYRSEEMVERDLADRERQGTVAIVEVKPIVAALEVGSHRNLDGLVSGPRDLEEDLVLALEGDLAVIQPSSRDHGAVGLE